jgi:hypothetical protein
VLFRSWRPRWAQDPPKSPSDSPNHDFSIFLGRFRAHFSRFRTIFGPASVGVSLSQANEKWYFAFFLFCASSIFGSTFSFSHILAAARCYAFSPCAGAFARVPPFADCLTFFMISAHFGAMLIDFWILLGPKLHHHHQTSNTKRATQPS